MRARIFLFLDAVRASYWFIPFLMLVGSVGLAVFLVLLDQRVDTAKLVGAWWIFSGGANGARSVLSAVASSVIGVAGTVFSITIAVLSLASSQFGPRLLRGFVRDRGNQFVLGTFVSTFLYCLLVLRMVRSVEESSFVPHIAVTGGVVLAIASIGVLLYFIHHISVSIQASYVIGNVARELHEGMKRLFPDDACEERTLATGDANHDASVEIAFTADKSGYLQAVDEERLIKLAQEQSGYFAVPFLPGAFVRRGSLIATLHVPSPLDTSRHHGLERKMRAAFSLGNQRTSAQDIEFLFMQITEIGVRALSPGTNDPYTALHCLDRLGDGLCQIVRCRLPSGERYDTDGTLRLSLPPLRFERIIDTALEEVYHYSKSDPLVVDRLQAILHEVAGCACTDEQRRTVEGLIMRYTLADT